MRYDDYDDSLGVALDLASLGGGGIDISGFLDRQTMMLGDHGHPVTLAELGAPDARRFERLGRRFHLLFELVGEREFLDELAAVLADQDCRPILTRHDGTPHLHYAQDGGDPVRWAGAIAAACLALHVCRHGRARLRQCAADGCRIWYADTSRNRSRRYCSNACASRTTVAAFRARQG
ncbi:MAG: CGNR zinc finger domain-containing protein [Sporichthyaceae bacterium]|nr:CGNR zinc finger domain-containing protein [Sporichthyaceae bacterium]